MSENRPDSWEDEGEVVVWGYRISGSAVSFRSQIDYFPKNRLEYVDICQFVCDRMADLLDECIQRIKQHNNLEDSSVDVADYGFRIYHYCEYFLGEEETLSLKLNQLSKSGKLKEVNRKGGLSEKVAQFGEIDFCLSSGSITLMRKINSDKKGFVKEVEQQDIKTYQEYLDFIKRKINDYNLLDKLEL
ncbi:hypothetical protein [Nostoc sp. 'Lobaria pulmonaria (5183) cyanobiont']|uniref:hypothetical protein n=1 Tax=Nostoc sp. 'Lobaria pulmonaria (5183) cyanobiont' TaxID=1618022 RepID=UPI000CF325C1|nr:hypothetical protein [Nostoc sp. 'Lobaria pulmonaria (5183) cyanobiont']